MNDYFVILMDLHLFNWNISTTQSMLQDMKNYGIYQCEKIEVWMNQILSVIEKKWYVIMKLITAKEEEKLMQKWLIAISLICWKDWHGRKKWTFIMQLINRLWLIGDNHWYSDMYWWDYH